jgi:hypothetical protein
MHAYTPATREEFANDIVYYMRTNLMYIVNESDGASKGRALLDAPPLNAPMSRCVVSRGAPPY